MVANFQGFQKNNESLSFFEKSPQNHRFPKQTQLRLSHKLMCKTNETKFHPTCSARPQNPPPITYNSKPPLSPAKIKRFFSIRKLLKKI